MVLINTFLIYLHVAGYSVLGWNHPGFAGSSVSQKHISKAEKVVFYSILQRELNYMYHSCMYYLCSLKFVCRVFLAQNLRGML